MPSHLMPQARIPEPQFNLTSTSTSTVTSPHHHSRIDSELMDHQDRIRSRRTHHKSRLGCRNCKARRIKVSPSLSTTVLRY